MIMSGQGLQPFPLPTQRITDTLSIPCWRYQMLTQSKLKEILHYDPLTGVCMWKVRRGGRTVAGSIAGSDDSKGAKQISLDGKVHRLHRVIWFYMTGEWPEQEIDHRNTNAHDNRWINLRLATRTLNNENRQRANKNSRSGVLGVRLRGKKYSARIMADGKEIALGRFNTKDAARAAYVLAKRQIHKGNML